jgi:cell wall-associated NlpC family hydrolase
MKFLFSIALITLALLPDTTSAQGIFAGICEGATCSACHLAVIGNTLIDWLIGVIMVLFAVLAVVAGFGLVTAGGNPTAVTDAKSKFTNAIIGLLIVLSAWLIVDTLMKALIGNNGVIEGYGPWAEIKCATQSESEVKPGDLGTFDQVEFEEMEIDRAGVDDTFESSSAAVPAGSYGSAGAGIVSYARAMDRQQCNYSMARRNGCTGSPGFTDCSDLVNNAFRTAGCRSPGITTAQMYPRATAIGSRSSLRMGDSVVYRNSSNTAGHVVICVSDGCSTVIHAAGRGAPDGQPATIAVPEQLRENNSGSYLGRPGARVLRVSDYCQSNRAR